MKIRAILMAAGLAIAAWLAFFGDKTPAGGIAEPAPRATNANNANNDHTAGAPLAAAPNPPAARGTDAPAAGARDPLILALLPRAHLIDGAPSAASNGVLFTSQSWTPAPPPPPKPAPPPAPTAPPLPFVYLGKKVEDNQWEVYLARAEQTYIVREQTIIESVYRIDAIKPPTLSLTYLPLNQVQILTIGGID